MDMPLGPGEDMETCQFFKIEEPLNITFSTIRFTAGAHHVLIWETPYTEIPTRNNSGALVDTSKPFRCDQVGPFSFQVSGLIAGSQTLDTDLVNALPEGYARRVKAGTIVVMDSHMLNASTAPIDACFKVNVASVPDAQVQHEAGIVFWYDSFITVPAEGSATARMRCPITAPGGITLFSAVSHMHRRGLGMSADVIAPDGAARPLYRSSSWEDPEVAHFPVGFTIPEGSAIDFRCSYTNPEVRDVKQGPKTTDEMCLFLGLYSPPSAEAEWCGPDSKHLSTLATVVGDGDLTCAQSLDCWSRHDSKSSDPAEVYAAQRCVTAACEKASGHLMPYVYCWRDHADACERECRAQLGDACNALCVSAQPGQDCMATCTSEQLKACIESCIDETACQKEKDACLAATCQ